MSEYKLHLVEEGVDRHKIEHPYTYGDGDHVTIVLKLYGSRWFLTDEGHAEARRLEAGVVNFYRSEHKWKIRQRDGEFHWLFEEDFPHPPSYLQWAIEGFAKFLLDYDAIVAVNAAVEAVSERSERGPA